jgi:uncharacterized Zn-finger protein
VKKETTSLFVIIHARFRSRTPYAHTYANLFVLVCTIRSVSQALSRPSLIPLCLMSFSANDELFCPICDTIYATANSAFVLSCADDGCKGHLCFDCLQKAVFPGNAQEKTCPHCRRAVATYSYAFFTTHKSVSQLQDKVGMAEIEVNRLTKRLAAAKNEAEQASSRLVDWCRWGTAAKAALGNMPSFAMPPHVRGGAAASAQPEPEAARSRSPRQVRPSGVLYPEYNG